MITLQVNRYTSHQESENGQNAKMMKEKECRRCSYNVPAKASSYWKQEKEILFEDEVACYPFETEYLALLFNKNSMVK